VVIRYRSRRARLAALSDGLRTQGWTWVQIAKRVAREEHVNMRVAFRLAHGMSQREVAMRWNEQFLAEAGSAGMSDKVISYWETWPQSGYEASLKSLKRLARIYQCSVGDLIEDGDFSHLDSASAHKEAPSIVAAQAVTATKGVLQDTPNAGDLRGLSALTDEDSEYGMKRRAFLTGMTALTGLGAAGPDGASRVLEALQTVAGGEFTDLDAATDGLLGLVSYYAHVVSVAPSAAVYDDILSVRTFANSLLDHSRRMYKGNHSDLVVTAGWLSSLLAISATDIGDHAAALVWCSDTERRGQDAGYPELLGWAALTRALIAYYQGQAGRSVTLACHGQEVAPVGTVPHAKLAAQEMRARAMLGDANGMADAKQQAIASMERLTPDAATTGAFSIPRAEDPPYTATSLLLVKRYGDAVEATHRVIETVYSPQARNPDDQPTNYARALLILGLAQAGLGRIDDASTVGRAALDSGRLVWPTMVLAGKLDHLLAKSSSKAAAAYHARYLDAAERLALPVGHSLRKGGPA
jgi:hypothetical protein